MADIRRGLIIVNTGPGKGRTVAGAVTKTREIKHAYHKGIEAQRGIEY